MEHSKIKLVSSFSNGSIKTEQKCLKLSNYILCGKKMIKTKEFNQILKKMVCRKNTCIKIFKYQLYIINKKQMRITTSVLRGIRTLSKRNNFRFAEQNKNQNKFFGFIKSAWQQTFPDEETQVRNKYQNIKQQKHYTKQEIEKMQEEIPQYTRTALTETKIEATEEKPKFQFSKLIPQSVKKKVTESESYKEINSFKENLKEYMSTRDGAVANAASMAYSTVANESPMARATTMMRKYIQDFSMFELEKQSTVVFKDAYNAFLAQDKQKLQKMANQQALQYFKAHIRLNETKKQKPKYTEIVFHNPAKLKKANVGQKSLPTFEFQIKIMQIYCMVNIEGVVVDGDLERVNESIFEFSIGYSGNHIDSLGHPWEIVQMKKIQEMKLLV